MEVPARGHTSATHCRYPLVYGPGQVRPAMVWSVLNSITPTPTPCAGTVARSPQPLRVAAAGTIAARTGVRSLLGFAH